MPKLTGVFSGFINLDKVSAEEINQWLKVKEQSFFLENFVGNRILYPQTIPITLNDLEIDLALLREFIKQYPEIIYSTKTKKMVVPEELELRFPPIQKLISGLLDILELKETTPVVIKKINGSVETIGTIITYTPKRGESFSDVNINGQLVKVESETVTILPNKERHIVVQINREDPVNVTGGSLGIVIDFRKAQE